ncbi:MAG: Asp-tRNA(Asn)/Glu-tRNA(Gln) amidotransferase subunit GatB [Oscillospiraceae bacterium]|jgi:aspartyl-tRNA(Asn)/glutamyl-tRNA(Gln) amidotransferase subunit B|nr:Asp-tRNA(Asn)/Glu-tRNA(Gln) amidotransferase subunit GatB [Oscillospiraceae bacterium]
MQYEIVIGLEVHTELATASKIFCGCTTKFGGEPNTHVCEVCSGMPGVLPVLNQQVAAFAVRTGLATNCAITQYNKFDRKNYFYPDLPKAYQISQLYLPICREGWVQISGKKVRIHEIHMEEDAGKLIHDPYDDVTLVDYNRCGVPLLEIVSEPDLRSAKETIEYLEKLRAILQYTGVSDCKMQEGSFRADINLSVRPIGQAEFGTRTEMKNMNSFKAIARAIESESKRQIALIESGGIVTQETRRWDDNKGKSFAMRTKEDAHDYKYFPEPDLPPIAISDEEIESARAALPELPDAKKARYIQEFGLPEYDTEIITRSVELTRLFEEASAVCGAPKDTANWMMTEVLRLMSDAGTLPEDLAFDFVSLGKVIALVSSGKINRGTGKKVFAKVFAENVEPESYVKENNLALVTDTAAIRAELEAVVAANEKSAAAYKGGKEQAFQYLIGQGMKALRGKASVNMVTELLHELVGA